MKTTPLLIKVGGINTLSSIHTLIKINVFWKLRLIYVYNVLCVRLVVFFFGTRVMRKIQTFHPNISLTRTLAYAYNHNAIIWHDVMRWNGTHDGKNSKISIQYTLCDSFPPLVSSIFFLILYCYFANINHLSSEIFTHKHRDNEIVSWASNVKET